VWNSKQTANGNAWYRQEPKPSALLDDEAKKRTHRSSATNSSSRSVSFQQATRKLPQETQPAFIKPQLALEAENPPHDDGWIQELKLDGYRMQARKDGSEVQMLTRNGLDWTARMPQIASAIATLPVDLVTLDGEVVVLTDDGTTSFAELQAAFQQGSRKPLTYFCFDLLHLNGHSTRTLPLTQRKDLLQKILASADSEILRFNEHLEGDAASILEHACKLQAEGIICKRAAAQYRPGRGGEWMKLKCLHEQEFVIGGYTFPSNGTRGIGSLLLGYYHEGNLIYAGRTGTGFTQKMHHMLRDTLDQLQRASSPFHALPSEARHGAHWVRPTLVAQVRFATWTASNLVRQAAFLGLREDKAADDVHREDPSVAFHSKHSRIAKSGASVSHGTRPPVAARRKVQAKPTPTRAPVRLTHPDKVLDVDSGLTKQILADYYWQIAPHLLPYISGRPVSLVRCPDGSGHPCFFQKHVNATLPAGIASVDVPDKHGKVEAYITLDAQEQLAALAQLGVLELHPWGSRNSNLEHADRLIFDLDPDEALGWPVLAAAASDVRGRLRKLGLESFLKTTGGKGLHVVAPIQPEFEWSTIKEFAHGVANAMERDDPSLYLTKMTKTARKGKIYVDYLRNERGATAVAPYSPRARSGAPVSMPLAWSELKLQQRPIFRAADFASWQSRLKKDPWKKMESTTQRLTPEALIEVGVTRK
jgi:bifunctional non-homologous end joining protein LigD